MSNSTDTPIDEIGAASGLSAQGLVDSASTVPVDAIVTTGTNTTPTAEQPPKAQTRKPDYVRFLTSRQPLINSLLGQPVSVNDINRGFTPDFAFYFVLGDYFAITQNMDDLFKTLKGILPTPEYPSKDCITSLRNGRALSLFEILRLHLALERLRTSNHPFYINQVSDLTAPLIGNGVIVPSLRLVDAGTLDKFQATYKVADKALLQAVEAVLKKRVRSDFISVLKQGQRVGSGRDKSTDVFRPYRVTDYLAAALCAAFEETTDLQTLKVAIDSYFPTDPTAGPGNGRWTVALPENLGNHIALIPKEEPAPTAKLI